MECFRDAALAKAIWKEEWTIVEANDTFWTILPDIAFLNSPSPKGRTRRLDKMKWTSAARLRSSYLTLTADNQETET